MKRKNGIVGEWYVNIDKQQVPLGVTDPKGEEAAWAAFLDIVAKRSAASLVKCRQEPVSTIIVEFLDSIGHKINAWTRKGYESYLRKFAAHFGNSAASEIDPVIVEKRAALEKW